MENQVQKTGPERKGLKNRKTRVGGGDRYRSRISRKKKRKPLTKEKGGNW